MKVVVFHSAPAHFKKREGKGSQAMAWVTEWRMWWWWWWWYNSKVMNERHSFNGSPWVVTVFSVLLSADLAMSSLTCLQILQLCRYCTLFLIFSTIKSPTSNESSATPDTVLKGIAALEGFWNGYTVQAWGACWHHTIQPHTHYHKHTLTQNVKHTDSHIEAFLNSQTT